MPARSPRISVCMPARNCGRYLNDAVESVLAQSAGDLELVLYDDASTDGTAEAVRERFPEVQVVAQPTNGGFASGVNAGIAALPEHGVICLLNPDAVLLDNGLLGAGTQGVLLPWRQMYQGPRSPVR